MKGWCPLLLLLIGCVQEPAEKLRAPTQPVVLPADGLQQAPPFEPVYAIELVSPGAQSQRPPLSAASHVEMMPAAATSVRAVRQVTIGFDVVGAGDSSIAAVEFVNAAGFNYARQELTIGGSPFDTHHLQFILPVAATAIDTQAMTGTWTARLLIDATPTRDQPFELTP